MNETRTTTGAVLLSPPDRYVSCYVASKIIHASKLVELRKAWPKIHFTARWPVTATLSIQQSRPAQHWLMDNVSDILGSETILVYVEPDDHLKGGLVEVGIAWAHGKDIYLAGQHEDFSKWQHLPRVHRESSLEAALERITQRTHYSTSEEKILNAIAEIKAQLPQTINVTVPVL